MVRSPLIDAPASPSRSYPQHVPAWEEAKEQARLSLGVTVVNAVEFGRRAVTLMFLGNQLGSLALAGGAIASTFANITGYYVLYGLASGMEPICSQAYGARNWPLVHLTLQRTIVILLLVCVPMSLLWLNLRRIYVWLGQDPSIAAVAGVYLVYALPGLPAYGCLVPFRVYLRSQAITNPMIWSSLLALLLHIPINLLLVCLYDLGVPGVAMADAWTTFNLLIFLLLSVRIWPPATFCECIKTWEGWSAACLREWRGLLKVAVPSCMAICFDWWWYELVLLMAGYLDSPAKKVAAAVIVIQAISLIYIFSLGLSSGVSARVGKELGADKPWKARMAARMAMWAAMGSAVVSVAWTTAARKKWGSLYTDDPEALSLVASTMPLIGAAELGNSLQTTGCGVLRGCSKPDIAALINVFGFYFVGTPIALCLAFRSGLGFSGLWFGFLAAQLACAAAVVYSFFFFIDWTDEAAKAAGGGFIPLPLPPPPPMSIS